MHLTKDVESRRAATVGRIKRTTAVLLVLLLFVGMIPQNKVSAATQTTINRNIIYRYLINEMGFNNAAACGVLANIRSESSFLPDSMGDKGTSYGLCQWHNNRYSRLIIYCLDRGMDYTSISGQLSYLNYELKNYYPKIYNYLKSVSNNANGAYNAGYYWCYYYEVPKNYATVAITRGTFARDKYWPDYNPYTYETSYSRVLKLTDGALMSGADVKYVQSALMTLGYGVEISGQYDTDTAVAINQFQRASNLTADGKCSQGTWSALMKAISAKIDILEITTQPVDCVANIGEKVNFTLAAEGVNMSYQWQLSDDGGKTWRNSTVKTGASYSTTLTAENINRQVRCVITDKYGNKVTSNAAAMKVSGIVITKQPVDVTVKAGEQVKFTVKAVGDGVSYQWQLSDDGGKTWRNSSVKTTYYCTTLSENNINRQVRCIISDKSGSKATSNAATMKLSAMEITKQPTDSVVDLGEKAKFTVKAVGEGITYQWQLSDDQGKTWRNSSVKTANYSVTLTEVNNGRYVRCIVTDKNGSSLTSESAAMKAVESVKSATSAPTPTSAPVNTFAITKQPVDCAVEIGGQVKFSVRASGEGLSYQWQLSDDGGKNWRNSSVNTADYYTTLTDKNNGRSVRCIITDKNGGTLTSNVAVMKTK